MEEVYQLVGQKVKNLRELYGYTQQEFADLVGLSRPSIANIEVGRQRLLLHDVETICSALRIAPKNFMRGIWWDHLSLPHRRRKEK